ncbi:glycosyltransferase [Bosea sp. BH3]|uniref:glycosyltransferase n=1 Tax=Bosea sp. BH3 TaxID=2871701 RepID=UPI0021CB7BAB|nr:glycosyltransferase [Bosea sp. BH3]MCU4181134.1 glycosyltransferase [Bosea sp. BH3]
MTQTVRESASRRILVIQKAGDFREAHRRRMAGEGDQYYGHSYVLDELERLGAAFGEVAIMCCTTRERYSERLSENLVTIGANADPKTDQKHILEIVAAWQPSHLIVNGPMRFVLEWGLANRCELMCILADSFNGGPLHRLFRYRPLARLLNRQGVALVANHGLNASHSLASIGVAPRKIVPWDWPYLRSPADSPVRSLPAGTEGLLYVGTLQENKGIGDLINAIALLREAGAAPHLTVVGTGSGSRFQEMATALGLEAYITFAGLLPNERVLELMMASAAVVVPSRHIYPEGFPLTLYEALCTRTPIIASDHPMFRGHLLHGETASIFKAGNSAQLAERIRELLADPALYGTLSANSASAWASLQNPVKWGDLIERWLRLSQEDLDWLEDNSLAAIQK